MLTPVLHITYFTSLFFLLLAVERTSEGDFQTNYTGHGETRFKARFTVHETGRETTILHGYVSGCFDHRNTPFVLTLPLGIHLFLSKLIFTERTYRAEVNDTKLIKYRNLPVEKLLLERDCKIPYSLLPALCVLDKSPVFLHTTNITGYCFVGMEK